MRGFRSTLISITSFSVVSLFLISTAYGQERTVEPKLSQYRKLVVKEVRFTGARSLPASEIRKVLLTKPNRWFNIFKKRRLSRSNVASDKIAITRFYERRGFLFTSVEDSIIVHDNDKAVVIFNVDEGVRSYLAGIGVTGGIPDINHKMDKSLGKFELRKPLDGLMARSAGFVLRDIYRDYGYPYANVEREYHFSFDTTVVSVEFAVAESVFTLDGETAIEQHGETHPSVLKRELVVKPGKTYSRKDIIDSEQRLYSTGLFKIIDLRKIDSTAIITNDTCRVDFNLSYLERKPLYVNGGFGVGREENFEVVLRSSAKFGHRNIMGTGRRAYISFSPMFQLTDPEGPLSSFRLSALGKKIKVKPVKWTFELNYLEPWPFNHRYPTTASFIYEPNTLNPILDYRYDRVAGELAVYRELDRFTTGRINFSTEYINIRNVPADQQEAFRQEGDNQIRRKVSFYSNRDTRDNIFIPQRGSYSFGGVDYVGGVLGGDFQYLKMQFSWSRYRILTGQNILATRLWFGWMDDLGEGGRSSVEDRFLLGGATTVRGYAENTLGPVFTPADNPGDKLGKPKGGRYMMLGNMEVRRPLFWRFGGTAFLDAGNTYTHYQEITPLSVAFSAGMGVQFFTAIGPLRLDYAVRLKKQFDLSMGNIHFSILYAF